MYWGKSGVFWDEGNSNKNWDKHGVTQSEAEQAFFDERKLITHDINHSSAEQRYILLGTTEEGRLLYLSFTIRKRKVRVISARDSNRKEKPLYEEAA